MAIAVLLVDDDPICRETLGPFLETMGYVVCRTTSLNEARAFAAANSVDVALVDIRLINPIDFPRTGPVVADMALATIVMAGRGNRSAAISAVHNGAFDFIEKPFDFDYVGIAVRRAVGLTVLKREVAQLRATLGGQSANAVIADPHKAPPMPSPGGAFQPGSLAELEHRAIAEALRLTGGNKLRAAKLLGIARSTLLEKLKRQSVG